MMMSTMRSVSVGIVEFLIVVMSAQQMSIEPTNTYANCMFFAAELKMKVGFYVSKEREHEDANDGILLLMKPCGDGCKQCGKMK